MIDQARSLVLQELMAIAWIRFESFESIEIIHMGFIDRLNFPVRRPGARRKKRIFLVTKHENWSICGLQSHR